MLVLVQLAQLFLRSEWTQEWLRATWTATFGAVITAPLAALLAWRMTAVLGSAGALIEHARRGRVRRNLGIGLAAAGFMAVVVSVACAWLVVAWAGGVAAQWQWSLAVGWLPAALLVAVAALTGHVAGTRFRRWYVGPLISVGIFVICIQGYLYAEGLFRFGGMTSSSVGLALSMKSVLLQSAFWAGVVVVAWALIRRHANAAVILACLLCSLAALAVSTPTLRAVPVVMTCSGRPVEVCAPPQYLDDAAGAFDPILAVVAKDLSSAGVGLPSRLVWVADGALPDSADDIGYTISELKHPSAVASQLIFWTVPLECHEVVFGDGSNKQWNEAYARLLEWAFGFEESADGQLPPPGPTLAADYRVLRDCR